ncbi:helix-turn-helix domain-containing protein [Acidovorax cavernicola]|uniref:AraC family transcriptional regulator n=1 Tax=Acidovorax cavernicola TaxID=1675792 RepID=A0A9X8D2R9_9BURK|nr:helix-turn-helix domain-containing protein [Acidovorax cavernicola]RIX77369.1 AraC family transcriptional regulator [Acidovorax cavernicola]
MSSLVLRPPATLAPYLDCGIATRLEAGPTFLPAMMRPMLVVFRRGRTMVAGAQGQVEATSAAYVEGPCLVARRLLVQEPTEFVSVLVTPGGWQALFPMPAAELAGQRVPLDALIGERLAAQWLDEVGGAPDLRTGGQRLMQALGQFARQGAQARRTQLLRLPRPDGQWSARTLAETLGLSERQFERRSLQAYGLAPREIRKLLRFSAAMDGIVAAEGRLRLADIALDSGYFDQAHFSRDFRSMTGQTPRAFLRQIVEDPALWPVRLRLRDVGSIQDAAQDAA